MDKATELDLEQMRMLTEGRVPDDLGAHIADLRIALRRTLDALTDAPHANECEFLWADGQSGCTCWKGRFYRNYFTERYIMTTAAHLAAASGMSQSEAERTLTEAAKQFNSTAIKGHQHCTETEPDPRCSMHGDEEHRLSR